MKSLSLSSSAGVTLAILAAAAVGALTTWMLMREPQSLVVVFEEAAGRSRPSLHVAESAADSPANEDTLRQDVRIAHLNPAPVAATSRSVIGGRERTVEPPQTASVERSIQQAAVVYQGVNAPVLQQANQLAFNNRVSPEKPQSGTVTSDQIDEALSYALEAADPYVKEGFVVREDYWGGSLPLKANKAVVHQLFKGNEYWFWVGTGTKDAKISLHIYGSNGKLAEAEAWAQTQFAAARVIPRQTGSYFLIVRIEKSDLERTPWAMAYGYR